VEIANGRGVARAQSAGNRRIPHERSEEHQWLALPSQ